MEKGHPCLVCSNFEHCEEDDDERCADWYLSVEEHNRMWEMEQKMFQDDEEQKKKECKEVEEEIERERKQDLYYTEDEIEGLEEEAFRIKAYYEKHEKCPF